MPHYYGSKLSAGLIELNQKTLDKINRVEALQNQIEGIMNQQKEEEDKMCNADLERKLREGVLELDK